MNLRELQARVEALEKKEPSKKGVEWDQEFKDFKATFAGLQKDMETLQEKVDDLIEDIKKMQQKKKSSKSRSSI